MKVNYRVPDDIDDLNKCRKIELASDSTIAETYFSEVWLDTLSEIIQPESHWKALAISFGTSRRLLPPAARATPVVILEIGSPVTAPLGQHSDGTVYCGGDADKLPFPGTSFDLVTCWWPGQYSPDAFAFVRESARILRPGGTLLLYSRIVPDDDRAAHYVNAFETLRDARHHHALSEYEWRGIFLDNGLHVTYCQQKIHQQELLARAKCKIYPANTAEQLQIMLLRAPDAVWGWLKPEYPGTDFARYADQHIVIAGTKTYGD